MLRTSEPNDTYYVLARHPQSQPKADPIWTWHLSPRTELSSSSHGMPTSAETEAAENRKWLHMLSHLAHRGDMVNAAALRSAREAYERTVTEQG